MLAKFGDQRPVFNKSVKYLGFIRVGRQTTYRAIDRGRVESFGFFDDGHRPSSFEITLTENKPCACARARVRACNFFTYLSCQNDNAESDFLTSRKRFLNFARAISYRMDNWRLDTAIVSI